MRAGRLRHRLELQRAVTPDVGAAGNASVSYESAGMVWGSIEPLTVRELMNAQQVSAQATHMVTIRYYKELEQAWRIRLGRREFDIEAIMPTDMRPIEMKILVKEDLSVKEEAPQ